MFLFCYDCDSRIRSRPQPSQVYLFLLIGVARDTARNDQARDAPNRDVTGRTGWSFLGVAAGLDD